MQVRSPGPAPLAKLALVSVMALILLAGCAPNGADNDLMVDINALPNTSAGADGQAGTSAPTDGNSPPGTADAGVTPDPNAGATPIAISELDGTDDATPPPKRTYDEYRSLNADVVGWIEIADTNVDYPIVQSRDNEDYLTKSVEKVWSKSGAIFVDSRSTPASRHVIIYGHNMSKSKTMFAQVTNYGNRTFYDNHRTFKVKWGDKSYTYKVFAVYSVDISDAKYMAVNFESDEQFTYYMNTTLAELSQFPVDTTVNAGDQVITLSTCTHTDYANGRFVVHAVRTS